MRYAEVAVPVPLPGPLTYAVTPEQEPFVRPGLRVKVPLGRRKLTGLVLRIHDQAPEGVEAKAIDEIVDLEPVLPADLLELARFTAEYYFAPVGEVVRTLLPANLPPWGNRKVWLTDGGALALPRNPEETAVLEALREHGKLSITDLRERVGTHAARTVADLEAVGRVASEERKSRGARYVAAVELATSDRAVLDAASGRSAPGRAVIEYLVAVARPATIAEVTAMVSCGPSVLQRLAERGALRKFTQVERLTLDRHFLSAEANTVELVLRDDQAAAVAALSSAIQKAEYAPFLLLGSTGAGKTEVYLRAAQAALAAGRSAIFLVPEIALVPALARAVEQRFGRDLAILHSGLGPQERHQEWERVRRGEARVVLGPRSALFAPVTDLGLLVVDEEQDPAYKQDHAPRYNGRDLALVRAKSAGATAVLVSATPSLESRANVDSGKLSPLVLTGRAGQGLPPEGQIVDLRAEGVSRKLGEIRFSDPLRLEITATLERGEQIILLRNRRGYAPTLLCRSCGEDHRCDDCGLPQTFHRRMRQLVCHYCGATRPAPERCGTCDAEALEPIGAGTERVEEVFTELFPGVEVEVLDRDAARRPGGPAAVLERFARGDAKVLIGTQMVSKGHHFPNVTLTAVLAADGYLGFPDFRAVERTYNLLRQLAGRAGRGDRPGRFVIQTYHPEHYAIRAALSGDDAGFAREELRFRRAFQYPPFSRMVKILVADKRRERAEARANEIATAVSRHPLARSVRVSGPAAAPLERLRGEWRFQLLLRSAAGRDLHKIVADVVPSVPEVTIDVDPQHLL